MYATGGAALDVEAGAAELVESYAGGGAVDALRKS